MAGVADDEARNARVRRSQDQRCAFPVGIENREICAEEVDGIGNGEVFLKGLGSLN